MPELAPVPVPGPDPSGEGEWGDVGSPAPIEAILARFDAIIAGAKVLVTDVAVADVVTPLADRKVNSYLRLEPQNFGGDDLRAAHVSLFVEKSWLALNDVHQWSVQFNRFDDETGTWSKAPAKRLPDRPAEPTRVFYSLVVPGFSLWAISGDTDAPPVEVRVGTPRISALEVREGESVTIEALVTNLTGDPTEYTAALWLNTQVHSTQSVDIDGFGRAAVSFTVTPKAGDYQVRIDRHLASFSVLPVVPPTVTPRPTRTRVPTRVPTAVAPTAVPPTRVPTRIPTTAPSTAVPPTTVPPTPEVREEPTVAPTSVPPTPTVAPRLTVTPVVEPTPTPVVEEAAGAPTLIIVLVVVLVLVAAAGAGGYFFLARGRGQAPPPA